jgi:cysteine-rich repeat protein
MLRLRNPHLLLAALGSLTLGCDYFDSELEQLLADAGPSGTGNDAATDGTTADVETDAGSDVPVNVISGADFCDPSSGVPIRVADDLFLDVSTTGLRNDFSNLSSCGIGRTLSETDTFFRLDLVAGNRYHFHVKAASAEQNLAMYLLSSCDERTCQGSIDECPAGTDEHLSFVPRTAGTYFVGIDGISSGAPDVPVKFLATRPVCGDNTKQHSEVCDDGNTNKNDGCDDQCRSVLADNAQEAEPNGDQYGANVVQVPVNGQATIRGNLGGPCDTDFFMVNVPQNAMLRATMLSDAGTACQGVPTAEMRLLDSSTAQRARAEGAAGDCPSLDGSTSGNLPPGDYLVTVRTLAPSAPFFYRLRFEIATP